MGFFKNFVTFLKIKAINCDKNTLYIYVVVKGSFYAKYSRSAKYTGSAM